MKTKLTLITTGLLLVMLLAACAPMLGTSIGSLGALDKEKSESGGALPQTPLQTSNQAVQPDKRQISVWGTGKVFLVPDVAYVYIGVNSQAAKVTDALAKNNTQAKAVTDTLKELGIDPKDIQTSSFNIYPQNQYDQNGQIQSTTYSVDNTVYVTVRDLNQLGKLLDAVVRSGANSINGIQFDVLDKAKAETEARKLAIANARVQADQLAEAINAKLGEVIAVQVNPSASAMPNYSTVGMGGGGAAQLNQVPISAGQLLLAVDVTVTYEIK